ncbi:MULTISPECIES: hypothetical protein [Acetobacter]|uniref:hypothetical protein n=1 Tax=Acetobacter TaxID=434 RepID=UPI001430468C|nr:MULTISPECIES: hypothetical protein [Acetobacter]MBS0962571.1 hypothetical protein [Acetobacter persici]
MIRSVVSVSPSIMTAVNHGFGALSGLLKPFQPYGRNIPGAGIWDCQAVALTGFYNMLINALLTILFDKEFCL